MERKLYIQSYKNHTLSELEGILDLIHSDALQTELSTVVDDLGNRTLLPNPIPPLTFTSVLCMRFLLSLALFLRKSPNTKYKFENQQIPYFPGKEITQRDNLSKLLDSIPRRESKTSNSMILYCLLSKNILNRIN